MQSAAPLPDAPRGTGLRVWPPSPLLLAGDAGGTKTVLALARCEAAA